MDQCGHFIRASPQGAGCARGMCRHPRWPAQLPGAILGRGPPMRDCPRCLSAAHLRHAARQPPLPRPQRQFRIGARVRPLHDLSPSSHHPPSPPGDVPVPVPRHALLSPPTATSRCVYHPTAPRIPPHRFFVFMCAFAARRTRLMIISKTPRQAVGAPIRTNQGRPCQLCSFLVLSDLPYAPRLGCGGRWASALNDTGQCRTMQEDASIFGHHFF